ncbi:hypothetical protein CDD80_4281 [Ophiocordyceps camponoti-rufipedis]|uniref:NAD+ kinase n=1 Tax=Ophiocordyceps camponoti-rufipedis TaxID=2004952 RepID=A0A2C5Y3U3_9HYPO|nr:hypothetical protein CDD80_4281 [Ophiocordyceps camponoti-rufipedis]
MASAEEKREERDMCGLVDGNDDDGDGDDSKAVTFDPANPYRRKASLVSSEATLPRVRRDQCLVHQFLDYQRRTKDAADSQQQQHQQHQQQNQPQHHPPTPIAENPVPSVPALQRATLHPTSIDAAYVGQADQQAWTRQMTAGCLPDFDTPSVDDVVHSRMLTKKQLSDMAWGVRELSRRLSSMRIRFRVNSIFVLTKIHDRDLIVKARDLTRWLLDRDRDVPYVVYVQDKLESNKTFDAARLVDDVAARYPDADGSRELVRRRLRYWDEAMCRSRPHMFDFVITLGGDGTVLYASWLFQRIVPPVLSFALGSLGFLTKFDFDDFAPTLDSALNRGVTVSLRLRFETTIMRSIRRKPLANGHSDEHDDAAHRRRDLVEELIGEERDDAPSHRPDGTYEILNEIVVDRGPNPSEQPPPPVSLFLYFSLTNSQAMSYTELFGDDEHFTSVLADGICVSTPTGSTAYNLAAGGSLCHPENPVMLLTSICAHTLTFRPVILPDTIVLRVGVPYNARTSAWASFDGRERVELCPGDYVTISASRYPFASVQTEGRRSEDWINSISGKLGWNTRQKQKGYKEWDN